MANTHENLTTLFTDIADVIREKAGTTDPIVADAFPEAISMIETGGGGDTSVEDGIIDRTITEITNSRVTSIGLYAFIECLSLTAANFPEATSIGNSAFFRCLSLTTASFPKATTIGGDAFLRCVSLTAASFPKATSIGNSAFRNCSGLTTVSFPEATRIGSSAFQYCSKLTTVSYPKATYIGAYAFNECARLTTVYLMGSSLCSLANSNAFSSTGITSSTGTFYVHASLITQYQSATNWAYFSTQFVAGD